MSPYFPSLSLSFRIYPLFTGVQIFLALSGLINSQALATMRNQAPKAPSALLQLGFSIPPATMDTPLSPRPDLALFTGPDQSANAGEMAVGVGLELKSTPTADIPTHPMPVDNLDPEARLPHDDGITDGSRQPETLPIAGAVRTVRTVKRRLSSDSNAAQTDRSLRIFDGATTKEFPPESDPPSQHEDPQTLMDRVTRGGADSTAAYAALALGPFRDMLVRTFGKRYPGLDIELFVDNAFTTYWLQVTEKNPPRSPAWFGTVIRNAVAQHFRRRHGAGESQLAEEFDIEDPFADNPNAPDSDIPKRRIRVQLENGGIRQVEPESLGVAMGFLPLGHRDLIHSRYNQDLSLSQIADASGTDRSSVKASLKLARKHLGKILAPDSPYANITQEQLDKALAKLPEEQRRVLALRFEGLEFREIAQVIGRAVATVHSYWNKGLKQLEVELGNISHLYKKSG